MYAEKVRSAAVALNNLAERWPESVWLDLQPIANHLEGLVEPLRELEGHLYTRLPFFQKNEGIGKIPPYETQKFPAKQIDPDCYEFGGDIFPKPGKGEA